MLNTKIRPIDLKSIAKINKSFRVIYFSGILKNGDSINFEIPNFKKIKSGKIPFFKKNNRFKKFESIVKSLQIK